MVTRKRGASQLNRGVRIFFSEFVRVSLRHPAQALFFARTVLWQGSAARLLRPDGGRGPHCSSDRHLQHH